MVKIKTVTSVGVLARLVRENARPYRIAAARGLYKMNSISNGIEVMKAVFNAIKALKLIETDEDILKALDGEE